jgi:hypothetical protein
MSVLNQTCFGQCISALRVQQTGPLVNVSSVAVSHGALLRPGCICGEGVGRYIEKNRTSTWVMREDYLGLLVPRILECRASENLIFVSHRSLPVLRDCTFVYRVLDGSVMGLQAGPEEKEKRTDLFPLWAAIVSAFGAVLVLAVSAMLVLKRRAASVEGCIEESEDEERSRAPSLRDPLLD